MSLNFYLNLVDVVLILGVSVPSVVMAMRIKVSRLRTLGILLASFFVIHGIYHLTAVLSAVYGGGVLDFLSDGFVEPLSYLVLLVFGLRLYRLGE